MKITFPTIVLLATAVVSSVSAHLAENPNEALLSPRRSLTKHRSPPQGRGVHKWSKRAATSAQRKGKAQKKRSPLPDSSAFNVDRWVAKKAVRSSLGTGTTDTQPDNIATGTATAAEGCTLWHTALAGEVCLGIIDKSEGLTLADFYGLNPAVKADCSDLEIGTAYCIDTDHLSDEDIATANNALAVSSTCSTEGTSSGSGNRNTPSSSSSAVSAATPVAKQKQVFSSSSSSSSSAPVASAKNATVSIDTTGFLTTGVINIATSAFSSSCGAVGASDDSDETTGPNGRVDWINCGISKDSPNSAWNPPNVAIHDVVVKDLTTDGVFAPCADYIDIFKKYGAQYDIPEIFLASFAMQESSCDASASGDNGGAYGLMQITEDKCGDAPNGDCTDPDYNIGTAAKYFRDTLDSVEGNALLAVAQYNGWTSTLTYAEATAAASGSCCVCQNNLDYLHQFFNFWCQLKDASEAKPYNNLAVCGGSQSGNSKRSLAGQSAMSLWQPRS